MAQNIGNVVNTTCTSVDAHGGCDHCNRKGLSFLPVRYAVSRNERAKHQALPQNRINAFTDIHLDKLVDADGKLTSKSPTTWYVLRKLRDGYLYVYDEHPQHAHWLCYSVGNNGELTQFPAGKPKASEKVSCTNDLNYTIASLVALSDQKTDRMINLIFIEAPFSVSRLNWIAEHPEWRAKHMQQVKISAMASSPFCFSEDEIQQHVIEYGEENPCVLLANDLEIGRFENPAEYASYKNSDRDTYSSLIKAFDATAGTPVSGYAVSVPDATGIIRQLDLYRKSAAYGFAEQLKPDDEGADKEARYRYSAGAHTHGVRVPNKGSYALNERNYRWYLAVDRLRELMATSLDPSKMYDGELLPPGVPANFTLMESDCNSAFEWKACQGKTYQEALDDYNNFDKNASDKIASAMLDSASLSPQEQAERRAREEFKYGNEKVWARESLLTYQQAWNKRKAKSAEHIADANDEILNDYIIREDWEGVKALFEKAYEEARKLSISFDSDYVLWVKNGLSHDLDKYDTTDPFHCGYVTQIIADILRNGILSGSSQHLWDSLLATSDSLVDRGLSLNGAVVFADVKQAIDSYEKKESKGRLWGPAEGLNVELLAKVEKNAAKVREFFSKMKSKDYKGVFEVKTMPFISTFKAFEALHDASLNATSSLLVNQVGKEMETGISTGKRSVAVILKYEKRVLELHNFGNTVNKAFYGNSAPLFKMVEAEFTVAEANKYVTIINKAMAKNEAANGSHVRLYDKGQTIGGAYHFSESDPSKKVRMYMVFDQDTANRIEGAMAAKGVDAMNEGPRKIYDAQTKAMSKVNFFSASLIKVGCICSLISAVDTYRAKDDFSSLWKLISSLLSAVQNLSEVISWQFTKAAESAVERSLTAEAALPSVLIQRAERLALTAEKAMLFSKALGHFISLMAVYDAVKGTVEAVDIYNAGGLSEDYNKKMAATGISFVSSIVLGLFISSLFFGAIIALAAIAVLFFFNVNRIVPEHIQNWLRRSKFGKEGDTAPGRPFTSMQAEQDALSMLLKGILFTASITSEQSLREKTQKEKSWMEVLAESEAASEGAGLLPGTEYKVMTVSKEKKHVAVTMAFPRTFSGSAFLSQKGSSMQYLYLVDSEQNVAKLVIDSKPSSDNDSLNATKALKLGPSVVNGRVSNRGNFLVVRDGNNVERTYAKDKVVCFENVTAGKHDIKIKEDFTVELTESTRQKNVVMAFSVQTEDDSVESQYTLVLVMGDGRKN
ncbi:toxin VasX [Zymobacter sp. IVIA_5232.4 C2]|uniref:toxin VasX n=1 Tax=Zymobacter sp. IVIA_5232.4 C2 TaxID=3394855 RepID=UPI0039C12752